MNEQLLQTIRSSTSFFATASMDEVDRALEEANYSYYRIIGPVVTGNGDLYIPWDIDVDAPQFTGSMKQPAELYDSVQLGSFNPLSKREHPQEYQLAA